MKKNFCFDLEFNSFLSLISILGFIYFYFSSSTELQTNNFRLKNFKRIKRNGIKFYFENLFVISDAE
jgi:hypothetical protein